MDRTTYGRGTPRAHGFARNESIYGRSCTAYDSTEDHRTTAFPPHSRFSSVSGWLARSRKHDERAEAKQTACIRRHCPGYAKTGAREAEPVDPPRDDIPPQFIMRNGRRQLIESNLSDTHRYIEKYIRCKKPPKVNDSGYRNTFLKTFIPFSAGNHEFIATSWFIHSPKNTNTIGAILPPASGYKLVRLTGDIDHDRVSTGELAIFVREIRTMFENIEEGQQVDTPSIGDRLYELAILENDLMARMPGDFLSQQERNEAARGDVQLVEKLLCNRWQVRNTQRLFSSEYGFTALWNGVPPDVMKSSQEGIIGCILNSRHAKRVTGQQEEGEFRHIAHPGNCPQIDDPLGRMPLRVRKPNAKAVGLRGLQCQW